MAVAFLKHLSTKRWFNRLSDRPADDANWPLGRPEGVNRLGDLTESDHLILTLNSKTLLADRRGLRCRVSALIFEPPVIHRRFYRLMRCIGESGFHRVLTHNSELLRRLPNARFLPHGGCWLETGPVDNASYDKTNLVSMIASAKRHVEGHRLRHRIAEWSAEGAPHLDLLGKGYRPLERKGDGHRPYFFSVVIENSREPGYFTEKILDSLLSMSLPIYWGAPDIAHFLDPRGLIVCGSEAELRDAIAGVRESDYRDRVPYLEANRRRALDYVDRERNAAVLLRDEDVFGLRAA